MARSCEVDLNADAGFEKVHFDHDLKLSNHVCA